MNGHCLICSKTSTNKKRLPCGLHTACEYSCFKNLVIYSQSRQQFILRCPKCQVEKVIQKGETSVSRKNMVEDVVDTVRVTVYEQQRVHRRKLDIPCTECGRDIHPSSKKCFHCGKQLCSVCSKSHHKKHIANVRANIVHILETELRILSGNIEFIKGTRKNVTRRKSKVESQIAKSINGLFDKLKQMESDLYTEVDNFFRNQQGLLNALQQKAVDTLDKVDNFCRESIKALDRSASTDRILSINQRISKYKNILKDMEKEFESQRITLHVKVNPKRISGVIDLQTIIMKR